MALETSEILPACPARTDGGGHLPRFPATFIAQLRGAEYACTYCAKPVDREGREV